MALTCNGLSRACLKTSSPWSLTAAGSPSRARAARWALEELGSNADAPNLPLWTRLAALSPVLNNLQVRQPAAIAAACSSVITLNAATPTCALNALKELRRPTPMSCCTSRSTVLTSSESRPSRGPGRTCFHVDAGYQQDVKRTDGMDECV